MSETRLIRPLGNVDLVLRLAIVALALATAYIHLTLGGLLFTLTAIGYLTGAVAIVVPLALAERFRWLVRLGLIGYTLSVIVGWLIDGARYDIAYLSKAIEIALIALLAVDFARRDGSPIELIRREIRSLLSRIQGPAARRA
jgi:hypothetical protein